MLQGGSLIPVPVVPVKIGTIQCYNGQSSTHDNHSQYSPSPSIYQVVPANQRSAHQPRICPHAVLSQLLLRALRPIAEGDTLAISYLLSAELLAPCAVRRRLLADRKHFTCGCARCVRDAEGEEPGSALPCSRCGAGQLRRQRGTAPAWSCGACGATEAPSAAALAEEAVLVDAALGIEPEGGSRLETIDMAAWGGHWVSSVALWTRGLRELRRGVEGGDLLLARAAAGTPLAAYFAWCHERWPKCRHYASSHAAEVFACLVATGDPECAALATQLCSPYLPALEHEYGEEDEHNVAMGKFFRTHCGQCGKAASTCCSRCKRVAFCGAACQKQAWRRHKLACGNA